MLQQSGVEIDYCPGIHGFKNWRAMAYHPQTQAFYIPMFLSCEKGTFVDVEMKLGGGGNGRIVGSKEHAHPLSPNETGQFVAMDIHGAVLWKHATRSPMVSAALTTAGGLAITGDSDRYLYVHDAVTGKIIFQTRLPSAVQGFPITYAVDGRQYLAIPVGSGPSWIGFAAGITKVKAPPPGNGIFVFALPTRDTPRPAP
jgi:alcohol dehydrogenase (cytochrome c)